MLYEKKRTFGAEPIDLTDSLFAMVGETGASQNVYAGADGVSATPATAGTLDYEEANQHFPDENTLEVWGKADGASTGGEAVVTLTLQSSEDGEAWKNLQAIYLAEEDIKTERLAYRGTIPAHAGRHMRLLIVGGGEAFTAGKLLALVRPL